MKKQRFDSVWDAIEPSRAQAANMKARAEMMIAIRETVAAWGLTQARTAKRLGLTQPRLNDLLRGRINKFSLDAHRESRRRRGRQGGVVPRGVAAAMLRTMMPGLASEIEA